MQPRTVLALAMGWVTVWFLCLIARRPLAGISASACWLAAVLTFHAWVDLARLRKRWRDGAYHLRPIVTYRWWLAPVALVIGILFGYRVW